MPAGPERPPQLGWRWGVQGCPPLTPASPSQMGLEAQRRGGTCPRSLRTLVVEPGLELRPWGPRLAIFPPLLTLGGGREQGILGLHTS